VKPIFFKDEGGGNDGQALLGRSEGFLGAFLGAGWALIAWLV
jgi:hypothetical protein